MRYIRRYENGSSSLIYKDGDIVVLDKNAISDFYSDSSVDGFLSRISFFQRVYIATDGGTVMKYYFKNKLMRSEGKFYLSNDHIKRLATPEEVRGFEAEESGSKFNL